MDVACSERSTCGSQLEPLPVFGQRTATFCRTRISYLFCDRGQILMVDDMKVTCIGLGTDTRGVTVHGRVTCSGRVTFS